MGVKLLYFADVRDALGRSNEIIELPAGVASIEDLRSYFGARGAPWSLLAEDRGLRFAVNRAMVDRTDAPVNDGDEVAVFPPVTGG